MIEGDATLSAVAAAPDDDTVEELIAMYRVRRRRAPRLGRLPPGHGGGPASRRPGPPDPRLRDAAAGLNYAGLGLLPLGQGAEDAELVAFRVGEHDPRLVALADVGTGGAEVEQAGDGGIPVDGPEVEVQTGS